MRLFVWKRATHATDNWHHTEGGLLAVGETLEAAREALRSTGVPARCTAFVIAPDYEWVLKDQASPVASVVVFPDAGCC